MSEKVERLVNLTVALLESRRPMTFAELRRRTGYYDQADHESARRMFERDKDDLRRLGVPVETRAVDAFEAEVGYVIDRGSYELPDVDLTSEEVAALALALRVAGGQGSHLALSKLAARAPDPAQVDVSDLPAIDLDATPADQVADAIVERRSLRFGYRAADGRTSHRTVDPYAVASRRGAWYLVGRDHDREAIRAFRLDRFLGPVRVVGDAAAFEIPSGLDVAEHLAGPQDDDEDVTVAVAPALRWEAELRGGVPTGQQAGDRAVVRFRGPASRRTMAWALGHGDQVEILSPPEARARAATALRAVAEAHG